MVKDETYGSIEKFLTHIFSEDIFLTAKVITAVADRDNETLNSMLDTVSDFINKLKNELCTK